MTQDTKCIELGANGVARNPATAECVRLTAKEAGVLLAIAGRRGSLATKEAILTELYAGRDEPELKIVDVFVCKLRKKLGGITGTGASDSPIVTSWGRGYAWSGEWALLLPDGNHVTMESTRELSRRLEDLALATDRSVSRLVRDIVTEHIDEHERRAWE